MSKIVEYHIGRLKDKNPQARLNAIQELVLLEDESALDALRDVYENDSNDDVRRAAQQAGRELFLKIRARQNTSETD